MSQYDHASYISYPSIVKSLLKSFNVEKLLYNRQEYQKVYRKANWAWLEPIVRENVKKSYRKSRLLLIEQLGGRCSNSSCLVPGGCTDIRCLQFDHIHSDGYIERKSVYPATMIRYYLKNPDIAKKKIQLLCANCNWIKKSEMKEHPCPMVKSYI